MLTNYRGMVIIIQVFRRSSMVEQEAVNFEVAGSSPAVGAKKIVRPYGLAFFLAQSLVLNQHPCEFTRAWLRFENEEQDRKVYFYGCDEVTE